MKLSEIKNALKDLSVIAFQLPNGQLVPSHFHVTEVGKVSKHFIDCGGTVRKEDVVNFQLWEANDYDHRLHPEKLIHIIELSEKIIGMEDLAVQSATDSTPLDTFSAAITISTVSDVNNMKLTKVVDHIYECLRPTKGFTLFDEMTGERLGNITCMNMTQILPVQDGKNGRVLQAVVFQASALDETRK